MENMRADAIKTLNQLRLQLTELFGGIPYDLQDTLNSIGEYIKNTPPVTKPVGVKP